MDVPESIQFESLISKKTDTKKKVSQLYDRILSYQLRFLGSETIKAGIWYKIY